MDEHRLLHFVKNILETHGAVVYQSAGDLIETLVPEELAGKMGIREDQRFGFSPAYQSIFEVDYVSYNSETLEKFSSLTDSSGFFTSLGLRDIYLKQKGLEQLAAHRLSFLNATHRHKQTYSTCNSYLMFNFKYTAISEEKQEGVLTVVINECTLNPLPHNTGISDAVEENLQKRISPGEITAHVPDPQPLDKVYTRASDLAMARIRATLNDFERSLSRRMKRDIERVTEYYGTIIGEIEKRITRKRLAGEEREREESRINATKLELTKKVRDQHKRYGLKVQVDLINAMRLVIPVVCMEYEVYRKRAKRDIALTWNPLIKDLEIPVCECCNSEAAGFSLCDERRHLLCTQCYDACPTCGKQYCRICHPRACPRCSSGAL